MIYLIFPSISWLCFDSLFKSPQNDDDDVVIDGQSRFCGKFCVDSVPKMFDYDHALIPDEPGFLKASYIASKEDK